MLAWVDTSAHLCAFNFRVDVFIEHPLREVKPNEKGVRKPEQNDNHQRNHQEELPADEEQEIRQKRNRTEKYRLRKSTDGHEEGVF